MAQKPSDIPICRKRGDTYPITFTIKDSAGGVVNISGFSYLLTVDPEEEPTTSANNLFQLTGVIPLGTDGKVTFTMTSMQADQVPAEYFYDIQQTDGASALRTVVKSSWTFEQDITK